MLQSNYFNSVETSDRKLYWLAWVYLERGIWALLVHDRAEELLGFMIVTQAIYECIVGGQVSLWIKGFDPRSAPRKPRVTNSVISRDKFKQMSETE